MTVTTLDPKLVGTNEYTVKVTKSGVGVEEYLNIRFNITIVARCELSAL